MKYIIVGGVAGGATAAARIRPNSLSFYCHSVQKNMYLIIYIISCSMMLVKKSS